MPMSIYSGLQNLSYFGCLRACSSVYIVIILATLAGAFSAFSNQSGDL